MVGPPKVHTSSHFEAGTDAQHKITCIDHKDDLLAIGVCCYGSPQWTGQVELWKAMAEDDGLSACQIGKIDVGSGVADVQIINEHWVLLSTHAGFWALLDTLNFKCVCRGVEHTSCVTSFSMSPSGKFVATSSVDGNVKVWDIQKWSKTKPTLATSIKDTEVVSSCVTCWQGDQLSRSHGGRVNKVLWKTDDEWISAGGDGTIRVWNGAGELIGRAYSDTQFNCLSFVDNKRRVLLAGDENGFVSVYDLANRKVPGDGLDPAESLKISAFPLNASPGVMNPYQPPAFYTNLHHRNVYCPYPITSINMVSLNKSLDDELPTAIVTHATPGAGLYEVDAYKRAGKHAQLLRPLRMVSEKLLREEKTISTGVLCTKDAKFIVVGRKVFTAHPSSKVWG